MEKTAMQIGIEKIKDKIFEYDGMENAATCFHVAIDLLTQLLPTEQQQIEAAYKDGLTTGHVTGETADKSASDYFKSKHFTP
jgi:hypothetical protein